MATLCLIMSPPLAHGPLLTSIRVRSSTRLCNEASSAYRMWLVNFSSEIYPVLALCVCDRLILLHSWSSPLPSSWALPIEASTAVVNRSFEQGQQPPEAVVGYGAPSTRQWRLHIAARACEMSLFARSNPK